MANKFRGEQKVNLNNTEYNTRLTLDGIMRIESGTGRPILKLATELMNSNLSITDCVTVLSTAIRAGGNNLTQKEIDIIDRVIEKNLDLPISIIKSENKVVNKK